MTPYASVDARSTRTPGTTNNRANPERHPSTRDGLVRSSRPLSIFLPQRVQLFTGFGSDFPQRGQFISNRITRSNRTRTERSVENPNCGDGHHGIRNMKAERKRGRMILPRRTSVAKARPRVTPTGSNHGSITLIGCRRLNNEFTNGRPIS